MAPISSSIVSVPYDPFVTTSEGVYAGPIFLAEISLAAFGATPARSLYLSTREYVDPDGQPWEPILRGQPTIDQGGNFLESSFQPVDAEIEVMDKRITGQAVSETFLDLLADYEPNGAGVVFYQALENLTSVGQFRVIFTGKIEEIRDIGANGVRIWCVQDRSWSKPLPPNVVTKTDYPYAPQSVIGARRQIVLGDWTSRNMTIPNLASGTEALVAGVARAMIPIPIIEQESAAGGLESPRGLVSDEDMHTDPTRLAIWESGVSAWAYSLTAPTASGSGPTYSQVAGDYQFYVPIIPIEDNGSTADNWQEAVRKDKPYTLEGKVSFDYNASQRVLDAYLPEVQELGTFIGAFVDVWYNKSSGGASLPRFGLKNSVTADGLADFPTAATSPTTSSVPYGYSSVNVGPTATGGTNTITEWADIKSSRIYADVRTAGQTLEIHRIVLTVLYRPAARLVNPGINPGGTDAAFPRSGRLGGRPLIPNFSGDFSGYRPPTYAYDAAMFGFGKGVPDSGHATAVSGHYTGTSGALIEHPVDVVHWALKEMGGEANIVTGSGEFGSFADARTALSGYKIRCVLADEQDVEAFIEGIGRQTLTWFMRLTNTSGAPFVAIPWDTTSTVDYRTAADPYTFTSANSDVRQGAFKAGRTPSRQIVNAVRVNYDYDPRTRAYGDQLYITPDGSRVYSGGSFTTDGTRVTTAGTSRTLYGLRELVHNVPYVADPATASSILTRLFDLKVSPRVVINFTTWLNAFDLERGHVIGFSSDWDTFLTYPKPGGDGSWASKAFRVVRVTRSSDTPTQYRVVAVEV